MWKVIVMQSFRSIFHTGDVKLKGIVVIADEELSTMRLFKSKLRMTFDDIGCGPDQEFDVTYDSNGTLEYPVKVTKFFGVHGTATIMSRKMNKDEF